MTKQLMTLMAALAFAACGSKPRAPTTPPPAEPDHAEHHDHAGSAAAPEEAAETPPQEDPKVALLAAEAAAWQTARPVFDRACASCHTTAGKKSAKKKLDHFSFDAYPPGGHHTATIGFTIRDALGINGKKATMPFDKPGSVNGDDLAKIKAWTDAWEAAEKGGVHPPVEDHHHDD
jgi:hypothetical protein